MAIYNNTDYTFTPAEQQAINNAAAWAGMDVVYTTRESSKEEDANLFHFYGTEDFSDYLFSIDVDADGSAQIWHKD